MSDDVSSAPPAAGTGASRRAVLSGGLSLGVGLVAAPAVMPGAATASQAAPAGVNQPISLVVNGERCGLRVDVRASLLDTLRDRAGLTGAKKGCNQGACGACTVLLDGRRVLSCLTLAVMHDGSEVTTVEGLAEGDRLHPVQQAFMDFDGFQCGFCTSGQIVSAVGLLSERPDMRPEEIPELMSGNLCRCAAYSNIREAIAAAARSGRRED
jgi:xanthine dehydrogenase YagT iron-sulfur-binding subunit